MVDFSGADSGGGILVPQLQQAYQRDPRMMLAKLLSEQGQQALQTPTPSPMAALAKALTIGLGGWTNAQIGNEYQQRSDKASEDLMRAVDVGTNGQKPWTDPDTGKEMVPALKPGFEGFVGALRSSGSKDLAPMAASTALATMTAQQKAKIELANKFAEMGLGIGPDGTVVQLPGFGQAKGGIKAAEETAVTPALVDRAVQTEKGTSPIKVQTAVDTARGTAPIEVGKAVAIENATSPIKTQTAANTAAATAPIDVQKATEIERNKQGIQQPQQVAKYEEDLRKEFTTHKLYKDRVDSLTAYKGIIDASTRDTKASDLNLVYGLAKMMDPGSVVREGEMVMVKDTSSLPDWLIGSINSINGGARLQPDTRKGILAEAHGRMAQIDAVYNGFKEGYRGTATRLGANPENILIEPKTSGAEPPLTGGAPAPAPTAPAAQPKSKADYDALTPGTLYIAPDGKPRVKQ